MAIPEHVAIVRQGAKAVREWRKEHQGVALNLIGANFSGANLSETNLSEAILSEVNLSHANLSVANLRGVNLSYANLSGMGLGYADLPHANLSHANLSHANLSGSDLRSADLLRTNLSGSDLTDVYLTKARCSATFFSDVDLSTAKELETINHTGPSSIGIDTLYRSAGRIQDPAFQTFLRGCGVPEKMIEYLPSLIGAQEALQFYSCFISHAEKDEPFANRLRDGLRLKGVRCWHYKFDLKMGELFDPQIDRAIKNYDKLIAVCSRESIFRPAVIKEIIKAIRQEKAAAQAGTPKKKLFPIRLDDFIFSAEAEERFDALEETLRREEWLYYIKKHWIGDFTGWKEHDAFEAEFARLLNDLRAEEERAEKEVATA